MEDNLQKLDFEKSLLKLEEISKRLEMGDISLDESLKIFEEGIKLSRICEKKLTETEQKLEILKSTDINESPKQKKDTTIKDDKKTKENNKISGKEENFLF